MTRQTEATRRIISRIESSLKYACVSYPEIMIENILDEAQRLVNEDGYRWDTALAIACRIYPATRYAAQGAYVA